MAGVWNFGTGFDCFRIFAAALMLSILSSSVSWLIRRFFAGGSAGATACCEFDGVRRTTVGALNGFMATLR